MADYIKREYVLKILNKKLMTKDIAIGEIKNLPTADVVEVVRCEKCKHGEVAVFSKTIDGEGKKACYCNLENKVTPVDWYCPSCERRDT